MTFHKRLKQRREELGVSIRKISKDLGVPKSTYECWEIDTYPRDPYLYKRLSDYLKITNDYLMYGIEFRKETEKAFRYFETFVRTIIKDELASIVHKM